MKAPPRVRDWVDFQEHHGTLFEPAIVIYVHPRHRHDHHQVNVDLQVFQADGRIRHRTLVEFVPALGIIPRHKHWCRLPIVETSPTPTASDLKVAVR